MSGLIHAGAWDGREYMAHRPERLLAIEPQRAAFLQLERNLGRAPGTRLVNLALGAEPGAARMHTAYPSHSSSLLPAAETTRLFPRISFGIGRERVNIDTLDNVLEHADEAGTYDRMVLDVQGYELEVLRGAEQTLWAIRWLQCEVATVEIYEGGAQLEQLDEHLERFGLHRTETDLYGPEGVTGDAVYTRRNNGG